MKKIYFLLSLIFPAIIFGQNCAELDSTYIEDVGIYTLEQILEDTSNSYNDSVFLPQDEFEENLALFTAVQTQMGSTEYNEIFQDWVRSLSQNIYTGITLYLDNNANWIDTLATYNNYSSNVIIDSMLQKYNLYFLDSGSYSSSNGDVHYVSIKSYSYLHYANIIPQFENIGLFTEVTGLNFATIPEVCTWSFSFDKTNSPTTLTFSLHDGINPFNENSYWRYSIDENCEVELVEKEYNGCGWNTIKTLQYHELVIYPNPTQSNITIMTEEKIENYTIINMIGQSLENGQIINKTIPIAHLEKGIYFIIVDDIYMTKWVKD